MFNSLQEYSNYLNPQPVTGQSRTAEEFRQDLLDFFSQQPESMITKRNILAIIRGIKINPGLEPADGRGR